MIKRIGKNSKNIAVINKDVDIALFPLGTRERARELGRVWKEKNREYALEVLREYGKTSKAKINKHIKRVANREPDRIYSKEWKQRFSEKIKLYNEKRACNPIRQIQKSAMRCVEKAIRCQVLFKEPCKICGDVKTFAHHWSYEEKYWDDVMWLCQEHHAAWHRVFIPDYPVEILSKSNGSVKV